MKLIFKILLIYTLCTYQGFGQALDSSAKKIETGNWLDLSFKTINEKGEPIPFVSSSDILPKFPGGYKALGEIIGKNLIYPKSAIDGKIEGRVYTSFTVDWKGKVVNVRVVESVRYDLDSVCVQALSKIPSWTPGTNSMNEKVSFQFYLPIKFLLRDPRKK
jgi:TonB family protein